MARASATAGPPEFLARERELEHLLALFEDASSGATRFAVVTGEPGIVKTRLVTEVCARLTDRASDHWARCYERQPSHWCWIKLLQELDSPPQVTERLLASYAGTDEAARFDSLVALAGAKEIGYQLGIADKTTEAHVRNLYRKIGVGSRAEATALAMFVGEQKPD